MMKRKLASRATNVTVTGDKSKLDTLALFVPTVPFLKNKVEDKMDDKAEVLRALIGLPPFPPTDPRVRLRVRPL